MIVYNVYVLRQENKVVDIRYIPEKFSILASMWSIFWLSYQRLWLELLGALVFIIFLVSTNLPDDIMMVIYFGFCIFLGFHGYEWISKKLERNGYVIDDVVVASSPAEAELRYFVMNQNNGDQHE